MKKQVQHNNGDIVSHAQATIAAVKSYVETVASRLYYPAPVKQGRARQTSLVGRKRKHCSPIDVDEALCSGHNTASTTPTNVSGQQGAPFALPFVCCCGVCRERLVDEIGVLSQRRHATAI